jgi:hypothetical protein
MILTQSNLISKDEFERLFKDLIGAFARNEGETRFFAKKARVYFNVTKHLPAERFRKAVNMIITNNRWWPTPAEILSEAGTYDPAYGVWIDHVS